MSRRFSFDPASFSLGWLLGRRQKSSGASVVVLLIGLFACLGGVSMLVCGVPYSWVRSREARSLPRPEPADLENLPLGTKVLVSAQVPEDAWAGPFGLALFYVERRKEVTRTAGGSAGTSNSASSWQLERPASPNVEMWLPNGRSLRVQTLDATFLNAQRFVEGNERRYVGYFPGQALAIEGRWEGEGLLSARAFYAGTPDDYVGHLGRQPFILLAMGGVCSGLAFVLLVLGGVLRLLGK